MSGSARLPAEVLDGNETVADAQVQEFWRWAFSDLLGNTLRGVFAEWLVARATAATGLREEWAPYDLRVGDVAVEVKSAAYIQSWAQRKPSRIEFSIAPTKAWDPETGFYADESIRQADVYVFCLLAEQDPERVDPLDLEQWRFFVLPAGVLDAHVPTQKRISLSSLLALEPNEVSFDGLAEAVRDAPGSTADHTGG